MERFDQFKNEFNSGFKTLQKLAEESFSLMDGFPERKDEVISLWKSNLVKFIAFTYKTGEKYNNKDVLKTITKAFIFGK